MTAELSGDRALHWLRQVADWHADRANATHEKRFVLHREALAAIGVSPEAVPLPGLPDALTGRIAGREPGLPWLLCAPGLRAPNPAEPWRPNADGSGLALLLALLEALRARPPEQDVLALVLPANMPRDDGLASAEAYAARPLLPLRGVFALWQVASAGPPLDVDARSLLLPAARTLADELFLLGRTLGCTPYQGGTQSAFPGPHVPFLERGLPAVPLCANADLEAGTATDTLAACDAATLEAVGAPLLRLLRGERAV